ncbi:thermonuclease family protein [Azospirillum canadense]|uniref:thermonuclease family protein n=1 Tax=Azospirillum canadense TaxID=403962 RepID=UPI0022264E63|nr:thermonuclease family protein [Azospirillum canadense]MCW2243167.1 endonuclease YncB(thermonuclease family) [Azospirillum canadense]
MMALTDGLRRRAAAVTTVLIAFAPPSALAAQEIIGAATVIDGDTLEVRGQRIRLHGVDAPESSQTCDKHGKPYRCGQQAALALADLIGRQTVRCQPRDQDRYGRIVGVCRIGDTDLNAWLVRNGHAVAYGQYSQDYVAPEAEARAEQAGIWAGTFQMPWDYRRDKRGGAPPAASALQEQPPAPQPAVPIGGECLIKGNISASGARIYHVPGAAFYDRTQIDTRKGERWFCSEVEAQNAGWRRASR